MGSVVQKAIALMLVAAVLSGCGIARRMQEQERVEKVDLEFKQASDRCNQRLKSSEYEGLLPWTECHNSARLAWWNARGFADVDLIRLHNAKRVAITEQYDNGGLSESELTLASARAESEFQSALEKRINDRQMTAAARQQAEAARQIAIQSSMPTSCRRIGETVTCY